MITIQPYIFTRLQEDGLHSDFVNQTFMPERDRLAQRAVYKVIQEKIHKGN